jgi:serine/threonine protein kinase
MTLNVGQVLQNRYRIDAQLGQGGMGAVYRATDERLGAVVAVKENLDSSPEAQKQFEAEARILANLHHPNLPRVSDHFSLPGRGQYLVMEYVEGQDLNQLLESRSEPLPESEALPIVREVLEALHYLHSQSPPIVHRDVKPANIKITPGGRVFLVDFGLAKLYDPHTPTTAGARGLTPCFAPPEQYGLKSTDARSDVYSTGATLYALLAGRPPPDALDMVTGKARWVPPRQYSPAISTSVESAIVRAMQIQPDSRFQTAGEFGAALGRRRPRPSQPPPPPPRPPSERPARRHAGRWAAALLFTALLAAAALYLTQAGEPGDWKTLLPHLITTLFPSHATPTPLVAPTVPVVVSASKARPTRTPKPAPSATSARPSYAAPALLEPSPGAQLRGEVRFLWQWQAPPLAQGCYFDLRIWSEKEASLPKTSRRGALPPLTASEASVVLAYAPAVLDYNEGSYYWTVVVVCRSCPSCDFQVAGDWGEERIFSFRGP